MTSSPTASRRRVVSLTVVVSAQWLLLLLILLLGTTSSTTAFVITRQRLAAAPSHLEAASTSSTSASPRSGILQSVLDFALDSPLWSLVMVPQARQKMVDTAASNGIPWIQCRDWIEAHVDTTSTATDSTDDDSTTLPVGHIPSYYSNGAFHAYAKGNLCWEAALEQEIASAAVGARNFPEFGKRGEQAFRESFQLCLEQQCGAAVVKKDDLIVDLGCGTGTSTRWLAERYPEARQIIGLDMSPYFIHVGQQLLDLAPTSLLLDDGNDDNTAGTWINTVIPDSRIELRVGAAEATGLPDNSVDVVNLLFVAHECPLQATLDILREAHRILKPNTGQLWFCEMDFETPGYAAQRANPLLFSLIRATEPYLDDYANGAQEIRNELKRLFETTTIAPATGRHFGIVATKGDNDDKNDQEHVLNDLRFDENGVYKVEDTHLILWDNKE